MEYKTREIIWLQIMVELKQLICIRCNISKILQISNIILHS